MQLARQQWKISGKERVLLQFYGGGRRGGKTVSKSVIKTRMLSETQDEGMEEKRTC